MVRDVTRPLLSATREAEAVIASTSGTDPLVGAQPGSLCLSCAGPGERDPFGVHRAWGAPIGGANPV